MKLDTIIDGGIRGTDVAQMLNTRPETVSRWRQGRNEPTGERLLRLLELEYIVQRLLELYSPKSARIWLISRHKALDGNIPADLIAEGKIEDVLYALDQLADVAYD